MLILWVILCIGAFFVALALFLRNVDASMRSKIVNVRTGQPIPGPSVLGAILGFVLTKQHPVLMLTEDNQKYGGVHLTWMGTMPQLITSEPAALAKVLMNAKQWPKWGGADSIMFRKSLIFRFFGAESVGASNGESWKHQRALMNPAFAKTEVFFEVMHSKVGTAMAKIAETQGSSCNMDDLMKHLTLDVLAQCIFGENFDTMNGGLHQHLEDYEFLLANAMFPMRFLIPFYDRLPLPNNKKVEEALKRYQGFVQRIISKARSRPADESKPSLLASMVKACHEDGAPGLTDLELTNNVTLLFVAGHETTAIALHMLMYFLADNPSVQEKLREEVHAVLGEQEPSYEVLSQMPYLNAVIKEGMRVHPPAGQLGPRVSTLETPVTVGDYTIPAGVHVAGLVRAIHHSTELWGEDAAVFNPDRFLPSAPPAPDRHPASYQPFGWGSRSCLGNNFSLLEQRIFAVALMQRFRVRLAPGATLKMKRTAFMPGPDASLRFEFEAL